MRSHALQTQMVIRILVTGAMGWLMMACSIQPALEPGSVVTQTSQADTVVCMSDADCPSHYFCDFSIVEDPTLGGICSPSGGVPCSSDVCKIVDLGPITSIGGDGGAITYCASCDCIIDPDTYFSGDVCGASTDELIDACWHSC